MSKLISIDKIVWDANVYPRIKWNKTTAESYADAMIAGDKFPAIILEKDTNILLDGKHRYEACKTAIKIIEEDKKKGKEKELDIDPEIFNSISVEYVVVPEGMSKKYYAATLSSHHGDRLSSKEIESLAIEEFTRDATLDPKLWGERLGVSQRTVYNWVSDILNKAKIGREIKAWRLSRLGWTGDEIGEKLGISRKSADDFGKNCNIANIAKLLGDNWNPRGLEDVRKQLGEEVKQSDAWAAAMDGMEDHAKFEKLDWGLRTWDDWRFQDCDKRFGEEWEGRIPAQLIAHTLYFFTKPDAIIMDPMAGGGTVSDTCLVFGRKCFSFDLSTRDYRPEIIEHHWDVDEMKFPQFLEGRQGKKIDLIFFDPPYFTKKEKEYEEISEPDKIPISSLSREKYLKFFSNFLIGIKEYMKPDGRLAFLNADWRDFQGTSALKENPKESVTIFDYHKIIIDAGWIVTHRISTPMSTERFNANVVSKMQEKRILGVVTRDLLIAKVN
jgi:DNA modification methylase